VRATADSFLARQNSGVTKKPNGLMLNWWHSDDGGSGEVLDFVEVGHNEEPGWWWERDGWVGDDERGPELITAEVAYAEEWHEE
jgi:hypothetical protein